MRTRFDRGRSAALGAIVSVLAGCTALKSGQDRADGGPDSGVDAGIDAGGVPGLACPALPTSQREITYVLSRYTVPAGSILAGADLDDEVTAGDSAAARCTDRFADATSDFDRTPGVDNQLAAYYAARGGAAQVQRRISDLVQSGQWLLLMRVSEIDDPLNDDSVTVTFYEAVATGNLQITGSELVPDQNFFGARLATADGTLAGGHVTARLDSLELSAPSNAGVPARLSDAEVGFDLCRGEIGRAYIAGAASVEAVARTIAHASARTVAAVGPEVQAIADLAPSGDDPGTCERVSVGLAIEARDANLVPWPRANLGSGANANLGCVGSAPSLNGGGPPMDINMTVQVMIGVANQVPVHFFADNVPTPGVCTGSCQALRSDASGNVVARDQFASWFAYEVPEISTSQQRTIGAFFPAVSGIQIISFARFVTNQIYETFDRTRPEAPSGVGMVSIRLQDCTFGGPPGFVRGAQLRVFEADGDGFEIVGGLADRSPFEQYSTGTNSTPSTSQHFTNADGIGAWVNVPEGPIRIEAWAVVSEAGSPLQKIACEEFIAVSDAVTTLGLGPLRADAPAGCM